MRPLRSYLLIFALVIAFSIDGKRAASPAAKEDQQVMLPEKPLPSAAGSNRAGRAFETVAPSIMRERFPETPVNISDPAANAEEADYFLPYYIPVKEEGVSARRTDDKQEGNDFQTIIPILSNPSLFKRYNLSEERYFSISFDNDIFSNTDYYYTSGQALELFHPGLRILPTAFLLPSAGNGSVDLYSLSIIQTLYTPIDPDKTDIQFNDRPFSSYLILGHSKFSNHASRRMRLTSRLDLGVIGPMALGGYVQKSIHDIEPVGWQNQIMNDVVANYMIRIEKGMPLNRNLEFIGRLEGNLGSLFNNLSGGVSLRASNARNYFESVFLQPAAGAGKSRVNYFVMLSADLSGIAYDATLQGGLFNGRNSIYTIPAGDISRAVFHARLSAGVSFKWFQLDAEQVFLTPEFHQGRRHMWSRIKMSFRIG